MELLSLPRLLVFAGLLSVCLAASRPKMSGGRDDASDVTWAHAVNSREALEKALAGPIDFLEADISLGHVEGSSGTPPVPIMAHPPDTTSDISLDDWLDTVVTKRPDKGIKLDFKSLTVLEPALIILQRYASKLNGSLWLGADILPGPLHPRAEPLRSDLFLATCTRHFPRATLALGWTTLWMPRYPVSAWRYEWHHVRRMADAVRCWYGGRKPPALVFSVRGVYASRSLRQLRWLLAALPRSSLLVWSGPGDRVTAEDFLRLQKSFPADRLHFDVPRELYRPSGESQASDVRETYFKDREGWASVARTQDRTCEAHTYTDGDYVLFGRPSNAAVLRKSLVAADSGRPFSLTGRLKFFAGEQALNPSDWQHSLSLVLADLDRLPKRALSYSKKKNVLSVRDPDVLWSAVNSSVLYTFRHTYFQDHTACRMFRLRIGRNLTFDAWTVPCDPSYEDASYGEVSEGSLSEVSLEESLDGERGPFLVGFHSRGEEYVLVYDLEAADGEGVGAVDAASDPPSLTLAFTSSGARIVDSVAGFLFVLLMTVCSWIYFY